MKKFAFVPAILLALSLSACGSEPVEDVPEKNNGLTYVQVDRGDGTQVECIVYQGYLEGSIDCSFNKGDK